MKRCLLKTNSELPTTNYSLRTSKGFSLVEAMMAIALFSLMVTGFSEAIIYGQQSSAISGSKARAIYLAEEGIEVMHNLRDADFANMTNGTYGLSFSGGEWSLTGSPDVTDIFTRTVQIADGGNNTKQVTVDIDWQQNLQRLGNISLVTNLTNWRALRNTLNCTWSSGIYMRDSFNSVGNTGNALKVQANGRYVYIAYGDGGGASYDFVIVDAGVTPAIMLGSLNIAGAGSATNIAISGDYAYVTSDDNASELSIVNISDPNAPVLSGTYDATGTADGLGVFASGTTVYLVRAGSSNPEFFIIDASNPASPSLVGSADIGGNGNGGNEVYVSGNYAYIASPDNAAELKLVDISNPSAPVYLAANSINTPGNTNGVSISGFGTNVLLGDAVGTVYIFDASNPLSITQTSTYAGNDSVNDMALGEGNKNLFLVSNSNVNEEFEVMDISNLSSPAFSSAFQWGFALSGVAFAGDSCTVYMVGASNAANPELIILAPGTDTVPPADVSDLATSNPTVNSVSLTWTAPGDDGSVGTATSYDVRYSTSPITSGNWSSATQVSGEPTPGAAGTVETMTVSGLSSNTTYYFAIRTSDEVPNESGISNVSSQTTSDGIAPSAILDLIASNPTLSSMLVSWTAPGDDGGVGTATSYDLRYSTATITEGNWASATQTTGEPAPQVAGSNQSMTVPGLLTNTTYFFAMKTSDEIPNTSAISNIASGTTLATQASHLAVNTIGATITGNTITGITLQNSGPVDITIASMSVSWSGVPGNRRLTSININGGVAEWTGSATSGTAEDITDTILNTGAATVPTVLGFNNTISSITTSIIFTMTDGSTKTVSGIGPL